MQVVKRDGRKEDVAFEKVQQRISKAATGLTVNATRVAQGVLMRLVDGITTTELDNITANLAYSWSTTHPDYATLAARIAISNHAKNTPATLLEVVNVLDAVVDRTGAPASLLDPEYVRVVRENAAAIEARINYDRDYLFDFFGFKTLEKAYLLRDSEHRVVEKPQHLWMRVSLGIWLHDLPKAFETYDLMSQKFYTHATPTLFNAATKRPQLSSCFVAGTPVHTMNGVKPIEKVEIGDEVVTHTGAVKKVLQLHRNLLGERKVFDIKVAGTPTISVTDNHRLWSLSDEQERWGKSPGWNSVEYLRTGDWIAIPNKTSGTPVTIDVKSVLDSLTNDSNNINYTYTYDDTSVYPMATWTRTYPDGSVRTNTKKSQPFNRYWTFDTKMLELLGIWYGDGSIAHGKNSAGQPVPRNVNIVSYNTNTSLIEYVTKMFYERFGVSHVSVSEDKHGMVSITMNNQYIAMIFKEMFKCKFDGKRLPAFFNRLGYDEIVSFLTGLVSSDGCVSKDGSVTIMLTNPPLVEDIFHLARSVGIPITMTLMHKKGSKATGRMNIPLSLISDLKKFYVDGRLDHLVCESWKQTRIIDGVLFMRLNAKNPSSQTPEYVYTLGVEDDHSYSVGGIIAENCFLLAMKDDSIRGIYETLENCALISQFAGGIGLHISNIRAKGSLIRGTGGTSNGLVPMLRVFNNTARYVDQCFAPDTLVATIAGPKRIADINAGDQVITTGCTEVVEETGKHYVKPFDTEKHAPHKVLKRLEHVYSGPLLTVKFSTGAIVRVTPKHPFLALQDNGEADYVEIEKLGVGAKIVGTSAATTITKITTSTVSDTILYDLEVEGTHDYYVGGAGFVHNGGGKRNGSFAMYLEPWHADVEDFLEMKKNTGSEENRARDLFYALWIPDLFMERVDANGDWTLFCPNEAPGLADVVGDEFKALYERYEAEGRGRRVVKAQKLWFHILDSQIETGTPYLLYKDAANKKSNQQNLGVIKSSNLCCEVVEYSSPTETAVCNLASLSLPAFVHDGSFDFKQLREVTRIATRNLNRVIDINFYPIPEAERSNKRHRPIGLGVQGLADVFAMLGLPWESPEAAALNRRIFAHMYYAALQASVDLAAAEGRYETFVGSPAWRGELQFNLWGVEPLADEDLDWDSLANDIRRIGLRNSLLVAPMPTASTSQILGNCECIEPYATHIFTRRTLAGEFIVLNKHLVNALLDAGLWTTAMKDAIIANNGSVQGIAGVPERIQQIFKTVWEIKQKTLIDMAAERGPYICQSQSLNLFLSDPDYKKLSSMHFYAWRRGLKTGIYYLRTRAVASAQKFTVEPPVRLNAERSEASQPLSAERAPVATVGGATGGGSAAAPAEEGCLMCSS